MGLITVSLSSAILCFSNLCHPALVGKATPLGTYKIEHRLTNSPGYGGDVLEFKAEKDGSIYAVHRVWLLNPSQHRMQRLENSSASQRNNITGGCINVTPEVYEQIYNATEIKIIK